MECLNNLVVLSETDLSKVCGGLKNDKKPKGLGKRSVKIFFCSRCGKFTKCVRKNYRYVCTNRWCMVRGFSPLFRF